MKNVTFPGSEEDGFSVVPLTAIHAVRIYEDSPGIWTLMDCQTEDLDVELIGPCLLVDELNQNYNIFGESIQDVERQIREILPSFYRIGHPLNVFGPGDQTNRAVNEVIWADDKGTEILLKRPITSDGEICMFREDILEHLEKRKISES